jgi:hypothetical protein
MHRSVPYFPLKYLVQKQKMMEVSESFETGTRKGGNLPLDYRAKLLDMNEVVQNLCSFWHDFE